MPADKPRDPILSVQSVCKGYGGQPVLNGVSLTVHDGDRIGLIGQNGSGKTTLLKILAGARIPDEGTVTRRQGLRVALLSQQETFPKTETIGQTLENAAQELKRL
ncbi:unnamed protein product, partial [marine sediment metagenome]